MGHKNPKGTVSIANYKGRIRLRWRYQEDRFSLNLSQYNKSNLAEANKIALQIELDMLYQQFDYSLNKYRSEREGLSPKKERQKPALKEKSIVEYFEEWTKNYRQMDCEVNIHYNALRNTMKKWGPFNEENALSKLNSETFGARTYNERLTMLKGFAKWLVKAGIWSYDPFEDVVRKKVKKAPKPSRRPFTEDEIGRILEAIKNNTYCPKSSRYKHSHYYPFIYFIFKTGVRPAEAVGLRVGSISIADRTITIKEVLARTLKGTNAAQRVRKETKNGKERILPFTPDLLQLLKPLIAGKCKDGLVFLSPTGLAIDDRMFQRRILKFVLKKLKIEERVLYAARHTFNSRCIDYGMTPVQAAFLMGNNPETALRNYTHQISLPTELPEI